MCAGLRGSVAPAGRQAVACILLTCLACASGTGYPHADGYTILPSGEKDCAAHGLQFIQDAALCEVVSTQEYGMEFRELPSAFCLGVHGCMKQYDITPPDVKFCAGDSTAESPGKGSICIGATTTTTTATTTQLSAASITILDAGVSCLSADLADVPDEATCRDISALPTIAATFGAPVTNIALHGCALHVPSDHILFGQGTTGWSNPSYQLICIGTTTTTTTMTTSSTISTTVIPPLMLLPAGATCEEFGLSRVPFEDWCRSGVQQELSLNSVTVIKSDLGADGCLYLPDNGEVVLSTSAVSSGILPAHRRLCCGSVPAKKHHLLQASETCDSFGLHNIADYEDCLHYATTVHNLATITSNYDLGASGCWLFNPTDSQKGIVFSASGDGGQELNDYARVCYGTLRVDPELYTRLGTGESCEQQSLQEITDEAECLAYAQAMGLDSSTIDADTGFDAFYGCLYFSPAPQIVFSLQGSKGQKINDYQSVCFGTLDSSTTVPLTAGAFEEQATTAGTWQVLVVVLVAAFVLGICALCLICVWAWQGLSPKRIDSMVPKNMNDVPAVPVLQSGSTLTLGA